MKRRALGLAALGAIAVLSVTNPHTEDFEMHIVGRFECEQSPWQDACQGLSSLFVKSLMTHYTVRQNFVLFSLYTVEFGGRKQRTIGVANTFILVQPHR